MHSDGSDRAFLTSLKLPNNLKENLAARRYECEGVRAPYIPHNRPGRLLSENRSCRHAESGDAVEMATVRSLANASG